MFVDSRRRAERAGRGVDGQGMTTFLSHSSLSAAERRRAEEAFATGRDCVIVATSTLQLGIDVGDLNCVVQLNAMCAVSCCAGPRIGSNRSSRRPPSALRRAADPRVGPAGRCGRHPHMTGLVGRLVGVRRHRPEIVRHLTAEGHLEPDGDFAVIGMEAERRFGRRYLSDLSEHADGLSVLLRADGSLDRLAAQAAPDRAGRPPGQGEVRWSWRRDVVRTGKGCPGRPRSSGTGWRHPRSSVHRCRPTPMSGASPLTCGSV